jgi:hypothetical protein
LCPQGARPARRRPTTLSGGWIRAPTTRSAGQRLGPGQGAAQRSSAKRRATGYDDSIWVVLQRRGVRGSAMGVPTVGLCAHVRARVQGPTTAPCGVAVTGTSPRPGDCLPVHASLHRGRVQVWLRAVWRRPVREGSFVGVRLPPSWASPGAAPHGVAAADKHHCPCENACWCAPPFVAGESGNGSTQCGGGRHPHSFLSRLRRLSVRVSHHHGRV